MSRLIELNNFVKLHGWATTGGQAKQLIRDNQIRVNGKTETRNRKALVAGDVVEYKTQRLVVLEEECLQSR